MERRDGPTRRHNDGPSKGQKTIQSSTISTPRPGRRQLYGSIPNDGLLQTEAEKQLQLLLKRQLATGTSLDQELQKKKSKFSSEAAVLRDDSKLRAGLQTLDAFRQLSETENKQASLLEKGLTTEEISLLHLKGKAEANVSQQVVHGKSEAGIHDAMAAIASKVESRERLVRSADVFSTVQKMTRREMEIEKSHYHGTEKAKQFEHLVAMNKAEYPDNDPVIQTFAEYERLHSPRNERPSGDSSSDEDDDTTFVGPILAHVNRRVTPLDESIIKRNCMSISSIKEMPKFAGYSAGLPNKVLYLKNLSKKTTKEELARLFCRYDDPNDLVMEYKIMTGRMKEQAFVTFPDVECASHALKLANGFMLNGKPIVMQFAKGKTKDAQPQPHSKTAGHA